MQDKLVRCAVIALAVTLLVAGCAGPNARQAEVQRGGTIVIGWYQEPDNLNVSIANQTVAFEINDFINDSLLSIDPDGDFVPEMAKELPSIQNGGISEDGLTITYHLRDGLKWSDGEPCTCDDWKYTWEVIMNPDSGVKSTTGWKDLASVECPDDKTVVFNFATYYAPHLQTMGGAWILPRHATGDPANMQSWEYNRLPTGNGPFRISEWASGEHITLLPNEHYYVKGQPYLDKIICQFVASREVGKQLIRTGQLDILWNLTESDIPEFDTMEDVTLAAVPDTRTERLLLNLRDPEIDAPCTDRLRQEGLWHWALGDVRVRQAMQYGIDKNVINNRLLYGKATVGTAEINMGWAKPDIAPSEYNVDTARALLEEAGWKDTNGDGVRECDGCLYAEPGTPLRLKIQTTSGDQLRENTEQVLQDMMKEIGIDLYIENIPSSELFASYSNGAIRKHGQFDILMYTTSYGPDPQSIMEGYYASFNIPCDDNKGRGYNYHRWISDEADAWIKIAGESPDLEVRQNAYQELSELVAADVPAIYLYDRLTLNAYRATLQGWVANAWGDIGWNAGEWSLASQ